MDYLTVMGVGLTMVVALLLSWQEMSDGHERLMRLL